MELARDRSKSRKKKTKPSVTPVETVILEESKPSPPKSIETVISEETKPNPTPKSIETVIPELHNSSTSHVSEKHHEPDSSLDQKLYSDIKNDVSVSCNSSTVKGFVSSTLNIAAEMNFISRKEKYQSQNSDMNAQNLYSVPKSSDLKSNSLNLSKEDVCSSIEVKSLSAERKKAILLPISEATTCYENVTSNENMIKSLYPNMESIQYCKNLEKLASTQTLVKTYEAEYADRVHGEAGRSYQEFIHDVAELDKYPLYDLVRQYQIAVKSSTDSHNRKKYLKSKLNVEKKKLWKTVQCELSSQGCCDDGNSVKVSHTFTVKEYDVKKADEVKSILQELEDIALKDAYFSYLNNLSKMQITEYVYQILKTPEYISDNLNDDYNRCLNVSVLKKCISILFHFQRQSLRDKAFFKDCQIWLHLMAARLLETGSQADYIFIVNHVIRCPSGIKDWASCLVQSSLPQDCKKTNFKCNCLYYSLLIIYLILNPAPARDIFLKNVETFSSFASEGEFVAIDSEGEEEELFEVSRNWTNEDVISLLSQIPVVKLYHHMIIEKEDSNGISKLLSEEEIMRMFAFSAALINVLFTGIESYSQDNYSSTRELIFSMIRNAACYVSDYWTWHKNQLNTLDFALQAEYDRLLLHVIFQTHRFQELGTWKFFSSLPYQNISKKMLWNILFVFHAPTSLEEQVYNAKDVDVKLQDNATKSVLFNTLKSAKFCDKCYLLAAYKTIAIETNGDDKIPDFIIRVLFQAGFIEESLNLMEESKNIIICMIKKYPYLMSSLLKEIDANSSAVVDVSITLFQVLFLKSWEPTPDDISLITEWLLNTKPIDSKNYLSRLLLRKMNWDLKDEGNKPVLPVKLHQEVALLIFQAYIKFDNKESVLSNLNLMYLLNSFTKSANEERNFHIWAWELIFSLKLHIMDLKNPPLLYIYDGCLDVSFFPDPSEDLWLQPLLHGYKANHPVACYLYLVMTRVGHKAQNLLNEGLDCLNVLIEHRQYPAVIQALYYILPFLAKKSEDLLAQTKFINVMSNLMTADLTIISNIRGGAVVGACLHRIAAMLKHQILLIKSANPVEFSSPLLKLWVSILLKTLANQKNQGYSFNDSAKQIHVLLDLVVKLSFLDPYTREEILDLLYQFGNPLLADNCNRQSTFWSKFFSNNTETYTILQQKNFPDHAILAWYVIQSELKQKHVQDLWMQVQSEMLKSPHVTPSYALKKSCEYLKINQPSLDSLPIYRWSDQILDTPKSHPILLLLWKEFFYFFFQRISDSQDLRSLGFRYFTHKADKLKSLRKHAQQTAESYRCHMNEASHSGAKVDSSNSSDQASSDFEINKKLLTSVQNFELCRLFGAFVVWIDDKKLHRSDICISSLHPEYMSATLIPFLDSSQINWFDFVPFNLLENELDQKVHQWCTKKHSFVKDNVESSTVQVDTSNAFERLCNHSKSHEVVSVPVRDFAIDSSLHFPVDSSVISSQNVLIQLIELQQNKIFESAKSFTEKENRLKQLNDEYFSLISCEFINEDYEVTMEKTCFKGLQCNKPAHFKLQAKRHKVNQKVQVKIENNRLNSQLVEEGLSSLPILELCKASVYIENCIRVLSENFKQAKPEDAEKYRNLGLCIFYHQIEAVNKAITSIKNYTPSTKFFSTSINFLGNEFIAGREDQLCKLAKSILDNQESGELAFNLFNPNVASSNIFLDLYGIIVSNINKKQNNVIFVLLNKIDLQKCLREKLTSYCDRRKLFKNICQSLLNLGSDTSDEFPKVIEVLRNHYRITLSYMFPELFEDSINFLIKGMTSSRLSVDVWDDTYSCFGCPVKHKSSMLEIASTMKEFSDNLLLSPDQQIFVSSHPITTKEVLSVLDRLHIKFSNKRKNHRLYNVYSSYIKSFGILLSLLSHTMLSLLNDVSEIQTICFKLWEYLYKAFSPWIYPEIKKTSLEFPWSDEEVEDAKFMYQIFIICICNFHDKLSCWYCEKSILSFVLHNYVDIYVAPGLRHYSSSLCHSQLINLPWNEFYPDSTVIEKMLIVLQSPLPECQEFLAKVGLKIPWIDLIKNISTNQSPECIRKTLYTLGKLFIVSNTILSSDKGSYQNNLKFFESLPWHFLFIEDVEELLNSFFSCSENIRIHFDGSPNSYDVYLMKFLKVISCMSGSLPAATELQYSAKRLLFTHKYLETFREHLFKCQDYKSHRIFEKVIPNLLCDIEGAIKGLDAPQQLDNALPLVKEILSFLNCIMDTKLETTMIKSLLEWIDSKPLTPLLLPCLETSTKCISKMTCAVMIMECCISTRFRTELQDPSEAMEIWNLILARFKISESLLQEFIHACVNKNSFLTLHCYLVIKIPISSSDCKRLLMTNLLDWIKKCEVDESNETKALLLWDKLFELCIFLAMENNVQVVKSVLNSFCAHILILGEDRSSSGILGAVGFGHPSSLSVNFRFLCRMTAAFILAQLPQNASIRLEPLALGSFSPTGVKVTANSTLPGPSSAAQKAIESLKALQYNKPYSALRDLVTSANKFICDSNNCLIHSRFFLKDYALLVYPKQSFLYSLNAG